LNDSPRRYVPLSKVRAVAGSVKDVPDRRKRYADLLISHGPPTAPTRLTDWLKRSAALVGARYASELLKRV